MSRTDALEARRSQAADAVKEAGAAAGVGAMLSQMRKKTQDLTSQARDLTSQARDLTSQARERAIDVTSQARSRAKQEVVRRRTSAAETLEGLAEALRPHDPGADRRARRRTLAVAGGSGLALTAALGLGVALGFAISRQLKKRPAQRVGTYFSRGGQSPHGEIAETDPAAQAAGVEDLDPENAPQAAPAASPADLQSAERMDSDYRERLQAGSDL